MLNYNAIVDFMKKFPEYAGNKFFVTGESYGGIYVPTLSVRIMEGSAKINFQVMICAIHPALGIVIAFPDLIDIEQYWFYVQNM